VRGEEMGRVLMEVMRSDESEESDETTEVTRRDEKQ